MTTRLSPGRVNGSLRVHIVAGAAAIACGAAFLGACGSDNGPSAVDPIGGAGATASTADAAASQTSTGPTGSRDGASASGSSGGPGASASSAGVSASGSSGGPGASASSAGVSASGASASGPSAGVSAAGSSPGQGQDASLGPTRDGASEASSEDSGIRGAEASSPESGALEAGRKSPLRVMALGDSTTGSVCWRAVLWRTLNQNGYSGKFSYVGSRQSDAGCTPSNYDKTNEGHPGVLVTKFVVDADELTPGVQSLESVLGPHPADVVLLHFATNDVWNSVSNTNILAAYTAVVGALRAANPSVVVLAAQLIPMDPVDTSTCTTCACPACAARIQSLNAAIPAWATSTSTPGSPVRVVDQWTGFNAAAGVDTVDGVHPNPLGGSPKIAAKWYSALAPLL